MTSFIQGIKQFFGKLKNGIQSITRNVFGKKKSASRKKRVAPPAPPAAPAAPPAASTPAAPPAAPAAQGPAAPQAAGRKMRAKNLRRMKFYKPSRRVMKKGRTVSRRNKYV